MSSSVPPTSKDRPRDDRPLSRVSESISRITSLQKEALERLVNRTHICGVLPTRFDIWTVAGVHGADGAAAVLHILNLGWVVRFRESTRDASL